MPRTQPTDSESLRTSDCSLDYSFECWNAVYELAINKERWCSRYSGHTTQQEVFAYGVRCFVAPHAVLEFNKDYRPALVAAARIRVLTQAIRIFEHAVVCRPKAALAIRTNSRLCR